MARQLKLLQVPRSSYYYKGVVNIDRNFSDSYVEDEMREIYRECPFYGIPRLTHELHKRGYKVNHKRVRRLQKEMGMRTIYPRPRFNTSVSAPENRKYPYLLRKLEIERPNQVWATDITYTAVEGKRAFVIAIIDLFSRRVMSCRTTNTMEAYGCVEVLDLAIKRYGKPEIFNSDQSSQFTSKGSVLNFSFILYVIPLCCSCNFPFLRMGFIARRRKRKKLQRHDRCVTVKRLDSAPSR